MKKIFFYLVCLCVFFFAFVSFTSAVVVSQCGVISSAGYYELDRNINTTVTCINITTSNIDLNCAGYTINYSTSNVASQYGIDAFFGVTALNNITIRNCNIVRQINTSTAGYGIRLQRTSNSYILNNTIRTNGTTNNYGIYLLTSCQNNLIANNTVTAYGASTGNHGIYLISDSSLNSVIGNNIVAYGTGTVYGLYITGDSNDNNVRENNISAVSYAASGNTDAYAVNIATSKRNDLINNYIYSKGFTRNYALYVNTNGNNNTIQNNIIVSNGSGTTNQGVYVLNSRLNTINNNTILTNGTTTNHGIVFSVGYDSVVSNNSVRAIGSSTGNFGVSLTDSLGIDIQNNNISTLGTTTGYGISLMTSSYNNIKENIISTNGSSTTNTGILLTTSLYNQIDRNNITTWGTSGNAGIFLTTTANENFIRNNTIFTRGTTTTNYGIYATQSLYNEISGNNITATGGTTTNYGINLITQANRNIFFNNRISTTGTTTNYGVFISSSSFNTFVGNNITANGTVRAGATNNWGTYLTTNSNENEFYNGTIITDGGGSNYGIYLLTDSDRNIFQGNRIFTNGNSTLNIGALLTASSKNIIKDNIISTNGSSTNYGVQLFSSSILNVIENNTINTTGATSPAIYLLFSTPNYPISNNLSRNNLLSISGQDINFGTASINGTILIDQGIRNYTFTGVGNSIQIINTSAGQIRFLTSINGTNTTFSERVYVTNNFARIDEYTRELNKSAEITLYNISTTSTELQILRNGVVCPEDVCLNLTSMQAGNVIFNVSRGGNYSISASTGNPSVELNAPADNFNASYRDISFNFTATDDSSDLLNCSIYINSSLNQTNSTVSSGNLTNFIVTNFVESNYSWQVKCYDEANNLGTSDTRNFGVAYSIPRVNANYPSNNSYLNNVNSVVLNYTAYDLGLNNMTVWLYGNGSLLNVSSNVTNGTNLIYLWSGLGLGQSNWSVIVNNGLLNSSTNHSYFNLINLTTNCEAGGPYQSGALVLVQGNISNGISGLNSIVVNTSLYVSGEINTSKTVNSLSDGSFQTTFSGLSIANYTLNVSFSYQGYNSSCYDYFNVSASTTGSGATPTSASLVLDKIVSLQELNSTTIVYNISLNAINLGGSNATNTNLNDSDSSSSPYSLGNLIAGNSNRTSYVKSYVRNSTNYNSTLSMAMLNATDSLSGNQIFANSSIINIIVPATTANTNITLTKNGQFVSENSTAVIYNLSVTVVNSGGEDLYNVNVSDSDISLYSLINVNRTQSYSNSALKTITKLTCVQVHNFVKSNASYSSLFFESNQLQILIPALASNSSLTLSKSASLYTQTSLNITYNITLSLTNAGGSNASNTNITDSDSTSSPYIIGNLTAGESYLNSYLLTLSKGSLPVNYPLANATAYSINSIGNNLVSINSSGLIVNIPAIATNASLSLTKSSSVYSINTTDIVYNITLNLINNGGSNASNTNITDSDSTSSPYLLNNVTAGQSILRSYLLNFSRGSTTSIITLSNATAYTIDSLSNNPLSIFASSSNITIPSNLTQTDTAASLILNKLVSLQEINSTTIVYNISLVAINAGGSNATSTNLNDSDSTSSPYSLGLLRYGSSNQTSYVKSYLRNSTNYNLTLSRAMLNATDSLSGNQISANSSIITLIVPATTANTNLTLTKNGQFVSENSTAVIYNLSVTVVNSGGNDLTAIDVADADISLSSVINLNRTQAYSISGLKTITKTSTSQNYIFLKSNASYASTLYESNQLQILIPASYSNSSLTLAKSASLHSQTSLNITYNITLSLTNAGGSNSTNTNITDSDSVSSPYLLNNVTPGQSVLRSYLLTFTKSSSPVSQALANATAYGLDELSNNLLSVTSSPLIVNVPAIATNASLSLIKTSSAHSLNSTHITYNITLSLTNAGGSNSTNTNITDSDSVSSPYLVNNLSSNEAILRSYLLAFPRSGVSSIASLSGATAYGIDSISTNLITSSANSLNITIPSNASVGPASFSLDKIVSLYQVNNTHVSYNITLRAINRGGSNATNALITDLDSGVYNLNTLVAGDISIKSYIINYTRNATLYNVTLSLASINGTDSLSGSQIFANSSISTIVVPSTTANTNLTLTKNAYFLSENSTSVIYNLSVTVVNSGGNDLTAIEVADSDIALSSTINLNRTQIYSTSGSKTIAKSGSSQTYNFVRSNATYSGLFFESNNLQILIPRIESNSSLSLTKSASLYSETSLNITYNISLVLVNSGGSNATNANITDSDSVSSPYSLGNVTAGQSVLRSYLFTLAKTSSSVNYGLVNASAYAINQINNNLLNVNSSQIIVNVPAIATNASLLLTKTSSVHSLDVNNVIYNITLSLTNAGGSNASNTNITDSDSVSSPYSLGNVTAGQSVLRSYLLNYSRNSSTSIISLTNASARGIDSLSGNGILSFSNYLNITIPSNLTQSYTSASLVLDKIVSFHNISNESISYNVTLRLTNAGGSNATNTNITDSDSSSSPYSLGNVINGESVLKSYLVNYTRNATTYSVNISKARGYGIDSLSNSLINSNSSQIIISVPATQTGQQLTLVKNAYFNSENTTAVNYTLTSEVINSGGEDLASITVIDSDLSLNTLISLNRSQRYNYSSSIIIQKAASNTEELFVRATATVNSVTYESNQINLQIPGYGGPADTIVYAPASVNSSTSFDSRIEIINQNPDIGQNFVADYWITNNAETINYSSGQQTIYISASGSTNLTVTLTSPSVEGTYKLKAMVSYVGGPDIAFDSFEVSDGTNSSSSSGGTSSGSSGSSGGGGGSSGGVGIITGKIIDEPETVVCNLPYIRHGFECCIDVNNNSICDFDESSNSPEEDSGKDSEKDRGIIASIASLVTSTRDTFFKHSIGSTRKRIYLFRAFFFFVIFASLCILIRRMKKNKPEDTSRLKSIIGKQIYSEKGNFIGKVEDIYLENHRIYGWLIKPNKKIFSQLGRKKIIVRHGLVKSIKKIMIIDECVEENLSKFKE